MTHSCTGAPHGIAYVVAPNPDAAYGMVKDHLDRNNIGFINERKLHSVEVLAEHCTYPYPHKLFIYESSNEL